MHVENAQKLIEHLRRVQQLNARAFDLQTYLDLDDSTEEEVTPSNVHTCGAVACIAGHAMLLHAQAITVSLDGDEPHDVGREFLQLDGDTADDLFTPGMAVHYPSVTAGIAADVLELLVETGRVAWPKAVIDPDFEPVYRSAVIVEENGVKYRRVGGATLFAERVDCTATPGHAPGGEAE